MYSKKYTGLETQIKCPYVVCGQLVTGEIVIMRLLKSLDYCTGSAVSSTPVNKEVAVLAISCEKMPLMSDHTAQKIPG